MFFLIIILQMYWCNYIIYNEAKINNIQQILNFRLYRNMDESVNNKWITAN